MSDLVDIDLVICDYPGYNTFLSAANMDWMQLLLAPIGTTAQDCTVMTRMGWLAQTWASVEHGMWYARSAEFLQTPVLEVFRWLRSIGDTIFAVGILAVGWFVIGLSTGWSARGIRSDVGAVPAED